MKGHFANCPISYKSPIKSGPEERKALLDYIFSGYETCDSKELFDACTQTDIDTDEWENNYFIGVTDRFIVKSIINHPEEEEEKEQFANVIESDDEDFFSLQDEPIELEKPRSINITLGDTPQIVLDEGAYKTKISLTKSYLEKNGLKIIIENGPERNVLVKSGEERIYPNEGLIISLPSDVNISIIPNEDPEELEQFLKRKKKSRNDDGLDDDILYNPPHVRFGVLSLAVDELEKKYIEELVERTRRSAFPRSDFISCINDEDYAKILNNPNEIRRDMGKKVHHLNDEGKDEVEGEEENKNDNKESESQSESHHDHVDNGKRSRRQRREDFKRNIFSGLDGDLAVDLLHEGGIDELFNLNVKETVPEKTIRKEIEIQTDVHIDPNTNSDFTFTDSEYLMTRFARLRGVSNSCTLDFKQQNSQADNDKTYANTFDTTIGRRESDISIKTEPTLAGIPELTDRNDTSEHTKAFNVLNDKKDGLDTSDEEISELVEKTSQQILSFTEIEDPGVSKMEQFTSKQQSQGKSELGRNDNLERMEQTGKNESGRNYKLQDIDQMNLNKAGKKNKIKPNLNEKKFFETSQSRSDETQRLAGREKLSQHVTTKTPGEYDFVQSKIDPGLASSRKQTQDDMNGKNLNVDLVDENNLISKRNKEDYIRDITQEKPGKTQKIPDKTQRFNNTEQISKSTGTEGLNNSDKKYANLAPGKSYNSPSLLKAMQSFEEELSPLKTELNRLHSEFQKIEIPEEMKSQSSGENFSPSAYTDHPSTSYDFYRNWRDSGLSQQTPQQTTGRLMPCSCPSGTCLGLRRSTGIECQRIRRLSPHASSSDFFREFTHPSWIRNNVHHPESIISEPEDILGNSHHRSNTSINNKQKNNKKS